MKNIARPIQVFGVRIEGVDAPFPRQVNATKAASETMPARSKRFGLLLGAVAAAVTVAAAALILLHLPPRGAGITDTDPNRVAAAQQNASPSIKCSNSDEQIVRPLKLLYQAVNTKNIDFYAAQWSNDAVYVDAATGKTRPKAEKIASRQGRFASWESVSLTMERVMVIDHALVKLTYSMIVKPVGKAAFRHEGRWVIQRNVDERR